MARALRWEHVESDDSRTAVLSAELGVPTVVARLLCQRGCGTAEEARRFLYPSLDHLHDPFRMTDLATAVDRLLAAVARGELVAIHGDYDVDGITSTVILRRMMERLGAKVTHFLPDRLQHGYGLQPETVEALAAQGVRVLVSVDCGIRSEGAAERARALGVDLIITDHHEPETRLPQALAVVNPKRPDCSYPDKDLAGVGVVLKLVQALCDRTGRQRWLPAFVKVAAIGTLADVVPLVGENRIIAKLGLAELSKGRHTVGLRALLEAAGLEGRALDSYHVAFMLAPRVNAAGRMSSADLAARLLLATGETQAEEARQLAALLNAENQRRQKEEQDILTEARRVVTTDPEVGAHNVLVVAGEGWHRGLIGIVAAKLAESFYKPTVVLSIDGDIAYGSARSIPAFDLLAGLEHCADLFLRFGGHRQAAGLVLEAGRVGEFRRRLDAYADRVLSPDDLVPRLRIDAPLPLTAITPSVVEGVAALEPFGLGNPRPVFHTGPVEVVHGPHRLKDRHLTMRVRQDGRALRAVAWRAGDRHDFVVAHRAGLDLAFSLSESVYAGERYLELLVADMRPSGEVHLDR